MEPVQPFVFLISDEGTHFKYITKQSHQHDVHEGHYKFDSMQFCCDVLAKCNYLEELDARASHQYCMDEIVLCYPQARQMVGVPILRGQDCVGVFCVVSSTPQVSIKACRKGLMLATSFLTMFVGTLSYGVRKGTRESLNSHETFDVSPGTWNKK